MKMLAVYDIADPKRLNRVAKILKDYGERVQYSKFEIDLNTNTVFSILQKRIMDVIDPVEDGVKFIPLCRRCHLQIEIIGKGRHIDLDGDYYIL